MFGNCREGWEKEIAVRYENCIKETHARQQREIAVRELRIVDEDNDAREKFINSSPSS